MRALGRKVIIKPKEKEEMTSSGLVVVDSHTAKHAEGTVLFVGEQVLVVTVDDRVLYSPLLFDEIEIEGETYHVVEEPDIFAII